MLKLDLRLNTILIGILAIGFSGVWIPPLAAASKAAASSKSRSSSTVRKSASAKKARKGGSQSRARRSGPARQTQPTLERYQEIQQALAAAGFVEEERRCFQLLPLWAGRPAWLWPLLHPVWKSVLKRRLAGRMLDEWISSLPGLRAFAFRHVIVCRKPGGPDSNAR